MKNCPQCKNKMKPWVFDVGYWVKVKSLHCEKCGFNVTNDKDLVPAMAKLRAKMEKEVRIIRVGEGLGIRFPNEVVKAFNISGGKDVLLQPEEDGIKIILA
jgi:hypothetical protein